MHTVPSFAPRRRPRRSILGIALLVTATALGRIVVAAAEEGGGPEEIPTVLVDHYRRAAGACDGLPWQVVAAIGWVESRHAHGRVDPRTGDTEVTIEGPPLDGENGTMAIPDPSFPSGWMHAVGPMQFLPTTWQDWARLGGDRPEGATPSPHNAFDAIASAGAYLCGGEDRIVDLRQAILRYNYDGDYVRAVLDKAARYGWDGDDSVGIPSGDLGNPSSGEETAPEPTDAAPAPRGDLACPVVGPVDLHDDFGEERAGGVRHRGNDLYAAPGALVVAPEAGEIAWATDGQRAVRTASGAVWVLIHNPYDGEPARPAVGTVVDAGTPLARVGRAASGLGLVHLELRTDGAQPEDAYPRLRSVCAATDR